MGSPFQNQEFDFPDSASALRLWPASAGHQQAKSCDFARCEGMGSAIPIKMPP